MAQEPCQAIIKGMINYIRSLDKTYCLGDIEKKFPKYFKAIMDNIQLADKACIDENVEKTKEFARNVMGYYKKAIKLLKEKK